MLSLCSPLCTGYLSVESIAEYTEKTAPYPVDKTKDIIEIVEEFGDDDYDDYFDEDDMIKEYENILLNIDVSKIYFSLRV